MFVADRLIPPKDVQILIPRTCESFSLHGARVFADMIKVSNLEMRDYPGLSGAGGNVIV